MKVRLFNTEDMDEMEEQPFFDMDSYPIYDQPDIQKYISNSFSGTIDSNQDSNYIENLSKIQLILLVN